jgi:hypothetical protein
VEDGVRICACDDVSQFRRLNVDADEGKSPRARLVAANRILEVGYNARLEVVDSNDLMTLCQQTVDQRGTNEPGRAGD